MLRWGGGCSLWLFVCFLSQLGKGGKSEYRAHSSYVVDVIFPNTRVVEVGSFLCVGRKENTCFCSIHIFCIQK